MAKKALFFLILLIVPVVLADSCYDELTFTKRLFSDCKLDNGECDDGEHLLVDKDCNIDFRTLFNQMWFLRIFLLVTVVYLLLDKSQGTVMAYIMFALFVYNGALPMKVKEVPNVTYDCTLSNVGACLYPSKPYIGWVVVGVVIFLIAKYFLSRKRKV